MLLLKKKSCNLCCTKIKNFTVKKGDEYVQTVENFTVAKGEITTAPQISIPKAVDFERIKIVLDWGELPWDLDAHILDKDNHVYYYSKAQENLSLDNDERKSYGPEVITIDNPTPESVYKYYVHDYTNDYNANSDKLSFSNVEVKVYFDDKLEESFKITPNQEGFSWYVFDIAEDYKIIKKDIVSSNNYIEF